jgi:hypothetical protein
MTGREEKTAESRLRPGGTGDGADRVTQLDAAPIAEEVYRSMLPRDDRAFRTELALWHPELNPERYLALRRYPRCWVLTAALVFAVSNAEYARALLESLRLGSTVHLEDRDDDMALRVADGPLAQSDAEGWRIALCRTGADLWFFGPQSMNRAFALGLNLAFISPGAARDIVGVVRSADPVVFERQLASARRVISGHPLSLVVMPPARSYVADSKHR